MSVSTTVNKITYTGDGVMTTPFSFPFVVFSANDLEVYVDGVLKNLTTHYTVALTATNTPGEFTGVVSFVTAPPNPGVGEPPNILIKRKIGLTQPTVLPVEGALPSKTVEKMADRTTMLAQQLQEEINRCIKLPDVFTATFDLTLPTEVLANKALIVNATADRIVLSQDNYVDQVATVQNSANAAATSATNASNSANAAATSATNASNSANAAATSATNASNSANAAASSVANISSKGSCRVATTANLNATYVNGASGVGATLTNAGAFAALVIDGITLTNGARVLVKNQTNAAHNGLYNVTDVGSVSTAWRLTRTTDYDTTFEIVEGTFVLVQSGTVNANTLWSMTTTGSVTVGTTDLTWATLTLNASAVTSIATGIGLTGGPITTTGTIGLNLTAVTSASPDVLDELYFGDVSSSSALRKALVSDILALGNVITPLARTSAYTVQMTDLGRTIECSGTSFTLSLPPAATRPGFWFRLKNAAGIRSGIEITIDPNGAETIEGRTVLIAGPKSNCLIYSNGTSWSVLGTLICEKQFTWVTNTFNQIAHGLPGEPSNLTAELVCTTAELGYSVGDVLEFGPQTSYYSTSEYGWQMGKTDTNIFMITRSAFIGTSRRSATIGAVSNFTSANWAIWARAFCRV